MLFIKFLIYWSTGIDNKYYLFVKIVESIIKLWSRNNLKIIAVRYMYQVHNYVQIVHVKVHTF